MERWGREVGISLVLPWELGNTSYPHSGLLLTPSLILASPLIRPSFPTFLHCPSSSSSPDMSGLCSLLPPCFSSQHFLYYCLSPLRSSPLLSPPALPPSCSGLKESLIYSKQKQKEVQGSLAYLSLGCNNRWMTTVKLTVPRPADCSSGRRRINTLQ